MAAMLIYHHALGLTPGVLAFAERMRAAGHEAHVFADESLPAYDAEAAQRAEARVLELLG
jgi:hypothetical protein